MSTPIGSSLLLYVGFCSPLLFPLVLLSSSSSITWPLCCWSCQSVNYI